ncbi:vascular endothelial growth factor D-like [Venturia canescens]|uniref:vascular endothelial growth factor D-like n=1 Tax=Venturia canescens TaxID=32260 RepID=UPI001C9CAD2C|nr:vascular endothelial growth factor D-like [Venturia canescens]
MKIFTFLGLCGLVAAQSREYPYEKSDYRDVNATRRRSKIAEPRISLKLAKAISAASTIDEFLNLVTDGRNQSKNFHSTDSFDGLERSMGALTRSAGCIPEFKAVRIYDEVPSEPDIMYFPECVRINRCGGCCSRLLECKPRNARKKNVEFVVSKILPNGEILPYEKKIVSLLEHIDCECDCKLKAKDCPPKAKYYEDECECKCQNEEDEQKCANEHPVKEWDHTTCSCHCREEEICSTGMQLNRETCRCEMESTARRQTESPRPIWRDYHDFGEYSGPRRRGNKDDPEY